MQRDRHLVPADRLDRRVERDLTAVDIESGRRQQADQVARRNRAEQLTRFRRLADDREVLAVELFGDLDRRRTSSASERASRSPFMVSKRVRLSAVARNALPRGNRKLRAKPSLTRTTSPIWPSRAPVRAGSLPSRFLLASADHVGKQPKKARALDRLGKLALLLCRHRGDAARNDLAALGHEALQQL